MAVSSRVSFLNSSRAGQTGVVELLERPGARVAHRQARALQRAQQVARRIGIEGRGVEGRADLGQQPFEDRRPAAGHRPGAEQLGQQPLVHVGPPRQPGGGHLGGHQRAGGLGREQQAEATPLGRRRDGRLLTFVLGDRIQPVGRIVEREERVLGEP